jgi:hypothetical protein
MEGVQGEWSNSSEDVARILQNTKGGILIEGIYPNGMRAYYGFGI